MYASQSFAYISSMMLAGLALVFCPLLLRQLLEGQVCGSGRVEEVGWSPGCGVVVVLKGGGGGQPRA